MEDAAIRTVRTLLPVVGILTVYQVKNAVDICLFYIPSYSTVDRNILLAKCYMQFFSLIDFSLPLLRNA